MTTDSGSNRWSEVEHALAYLERIDDVPHRTEGETELLRVLRPPVERVLDLGCGDGRLLGLVLTAYPDVTGVAADFSDTMLGRARERFGDDGRVEVIAHDLADPLPPLGRFDAVVSSFAIHHLTHTRKEALYTEVFSLLRPGGVFANLEHVASPTAGLHREFLDSIGETPESEDPSNILADVETQLVWLRAIGFDHVDCLWKWRELALLAGVRPR
jgi:tRNA (cmo5U34)-methyltransferase